MSYARSHRPLMRRMVEEHPVFAFRLLLLVIVGFSFLLFLEFDRVWAGIDLQQSPVLAEEAPASGVTDAAAASDFVYFLSQYVNQATEIEELRPQF